MNDRAADRATRLAPRWAFGPCIALCLLLGGDVPARDRNPWAVPDHRPPAPTYQPYNDGRFAPPEYDPTFDRRRPRDPVAPLTQPGTRYDEMLRHTPGISYGLQAPGVAGTLYPGLGDSYGLLSPWSLGYPGLGLYPGLLPYGGYPGSSMLYPGTGLGTSGLLSPLYGSPLGTVPLFGLHY